MCFLAVTGRLLFVVYLDLTCLFISWRCAHFYQHFFSCLCSIAFISYLYPNGKKEPGANISKYFWREARNIYQTVCFVCPSYNFNSFMSCFFSIKSIGCYTSYVIHKRTVLFWWLLYRRLLCYLISLSSPHWRQTSTDVFSTFSFCLPHIARYLYTSICFLHPHNNFSNVDSNAHLSPTLSYSRVFSEWTHWHGSTGQDGRVQHYKIH